MVDGEGGVKALGLKMARRDIRGLQQTNLLVYVGARREGQ